MNIHHSTIWSWSRAALVTLFFITVVALPAWVRAIDSKPAAKNEPASLSAAETDVQVEVLSLTLSKLERDNFGGAISPFYDYGISKEQSGTVVLAKITPPDATHLKLMNKKCRLISFHDDAGTDLFTNASARLGDDFFSGNRPMELLTAKNSDCFGVRIRSARLPAPTATRLTAEVLLTFAPPTGECSDRKEKLLIKDGQVTTVGPMKIKLRIMPANPYQQTNRPAAARQQPDCWLASFLPKHGTTITSVAFLSEASDQPILLAKDLDDEGNAASFNGGTYRTGAEPSEAKDDFARLTGYGPNSLSLWDAAQHKELRLVKAHSNWVTTLGFSPDSRLLISGGGDNTARIWEVATGKEIGRIRVQEDGCVYVNAVSFSADGKYVLAAAENDMVIVVKAPK